MNFLGGRPKHLQDETLLLLDEDGLASRVARQAEAHLLVCHACRLRRQVLRREDQSLQAATHLPVPASDAARARLLAGLQVAATASPGAGHWNLWRTSVLRPAVLLRAGAVMALLVFAVTYRQAERPLQDLVAAYEETGPKPDHALTPGSASTLTTAEVCRLTDDDLDPELSPERQRAVFHAYRMDEHAAKAYQVDYLINPQLGGDDSLQNLWPEPYHATVWNATAKDALETRLHAMVCNHQIDLQVAQQELATDWIAAYKKYFHTARPARTVATAVTKVLPYARNCR